MAIGSGRWRSRWLNARNPEALAEPGMNGRRGEDDGDGGG